MVGKYDCLLTLCLVLPSNDHQPVSYSAYVKWLQERLEESYAFVQSHVSKKQLRQKYHYDRQVHGHHYEKDDLVWLFNPAVTKGRAKKFHCPWTGPFIICRKLSDLN